MIDTVALGSLPKISTKQIAIARLPDLIGGLLTEVTTVEVRLPLSRKLVTVT